MTHLGASQQRRSLIFCSTHEHWNCRRSKDGTKEHSKQSQAMTGLKGQLTGKRKPFKLYHFFSPICMPPLCCSNGPAFVFMCHTLRFCAMPFVIFYYFMSSLILSSHLFFFSIPALAYLTSYWCCRSLPSVSRNHTISVVSFWRRLSLVRCCFSPDVFIYLFIYLFMMPYYLPRSRPTPFLMGSFLVLPLAHSSIRITCASYWH